MSVRPAGRAGETDTDATDETCGTLGLMAEFLVNVQGLPE